MLVCLRAIKILFTGVCQYIKREDILFFGLSKWKILELSSSRLATVASCNFHRYSIYYSYYYIPNKFKLSTIYFFLLTALSLGFGSNVLQIVYIETRAIDVNYFVTRLIRHPPVSQMYSVYSRLSCSRLSDLIQNNST